MLRRRYPLAIGTRALFLHFFYVCLFAWLRALALLLGAANPYRASTPHSILTASPVFKFAKFVALSVCGMSATVNDVSLLRATVSETPLTAMEPCETTYRDNVRGSCTRTSRDRPSFSMPTTRALRSTGPATKCP